LKRGVGRPGKARNNNGKKKKKREQNIAQEEISEYPKQPATKGAIQQYLHSMGHRLSPGGGQRVQGKKRH